MLEGSNDGRNWSHIHGVTGFSDWRGERGGRGYPKNGRIFWFANSESFRMARLRVTETVGGGEPRMTEVRLFERSVFGHPMEHMLPR